MKAERLRLRRPHFATAEEQRRRIDQRLGASFQLLAEYGSDRGVAGHRAARHPGHRNRSCAHLRGVHFGHIPASDSPPVDDYGRSRVERHRLRNSRRTARSGRDAVAWLTHCKSTIDYSVTAFLMSPPPRA